MHEEPYLERCLKPNWYIYWQHTIYRIVSLGSENSYELHLEVDVTGEPRTVRLEQLIMGNEDEVALFAPTHEQLYEEIQYRHSPPEIAPTSSLPPLLLKKAERIITVIEEVNMQIDSIQSALAHAIFHKSSHTDLGIKEEWACYGIPIQLSLDNALAHHSHSLKNLVRTIGQNGKYHTIDLVFRPPYKARYGALIESLFGKLSNRIKQELSGAIQSQNPKDIRRAAEDACLLYEDVYRYFSPH